LPFGSPKFPRGTMSPDLNALWQFRNLQDPFTAELPAKAGERIDQIMGHGPVMERTGHGPVKKRGTRSKPRIGLVWRCGGTPRSAGQSPRAPSSWPCADARGQHSRGAGKSLPRSFRLLQLERNPVSRGCACGRNSCIVLSDLLVICR
jgi:hypothetical protein